MEIIVGLVVVIGAIAYLVTRKKDLAEANQAAPYKVETPVPAADVAPQPVIAVEGAGAVEVPAEKPAKAKKAPAKKPAAKPAAKKPAAPKKPAAKKAPAKKKPSA